MDRTLRRELKSMFNNYWFDTTTYKNSILLKIKYLNGYFQFEVPKSRVTNSSARIHGSPTGERETNSAYKNNPN